jgi:hypothetical protein
MPAAFPARSGPSNLIQHIVSRQVKSSIERNTKDFVGQRDVNFQKRAGEVVENKKAA